MSLSARALGDVSCRATALTVEHLRRRNMPTAHLTRGLGRTLDDLVNPAVAVSWDEFLTFFRNCSAGLGPTEWVELCTAYTGSPSVRPLLSAAGLWFHPARYFEWVADPVDGAIRHVFSCLDTRCARTGDREVRVELAVRPGYAPAPAAFWEAHALGLGALPTHFGLAPALVTWEPIERGAAYRVRLPRRRPVRFVLSWVAALFRRDTAADVRAALAFGRERNLRLEQEIAERERTERALQESERRFQRITDAIPGVVYQYYLDPDGRQGFVFVSGGAEALTGYTPAELIDRPELVWERIDPTHVPALQHSVQESARTGAPWRLEFPFHTRSGEVRWIRGQSVPEPVLPSDRIVWNGILTDVTEHKRAEGELRARDALLRKLSERVPGFIYQYQQGPDGRTAFPYASEGIRDIYEVAPGDVRESAGAVFGRLHPDDYARVADTIARSWETLGPWRCEYRVRLPERGERWLDGDAVPERMPDGSTLWHGYIRDVTDRKRVEEALRESEVRYRQLFEAHPHPMWVYDLNTLAFLAVNQAAVVKYGYTRDEFLARTIKDIRPPDDVPALLANVAAVTDGFEDAGVWRHRLKDGRLIWVRITSHTLAFGGHPAEVVLAQDVTEQFRAEDELRQERDRLTMLAATAPGVLYTFRERPTGARSFSYISPGVRNLFGCAPEELAQDPTILRNAIHPDDLERHLANIVESAQALTPIEAEYRVRHPSRGELWVRVQTAPVREPDGSTVWHGFVVDVTERKRAEQALRESEERLRLALAAGRMGIFDWDLTTDRVVWSDTHYELFGYPPGDRFPVAFHHFSDRLHPDDRPAVERAIREARATRKPYSNESRIVLPDGAVRWVQGSGEFRSDTDGRAVRMLGTVSDITERKRAERLVRESEERLKFSLAAAAVGDWDMDLRTNVARRSLRHDQCFGYTEPVAVWGYDTFLAHVQPVDRERVDATYQAALAGEGDYDVEFRVTWPDGSPHWLWSKGRFYFDETGRPYRVAGIQVDITERKRADATLRASEERFRAFMRLSPLLAWIVTADGRFLFSNHGFAALLKMTPDAVERATIHDVFPPEYAAEYIANNRRVLESAAPVETIEHALRPDGTEGVFLAYKFLVPSPDGSPQIGGIAIDITERRRAETALRESEERLRLALAAGRMGIFDWDLTTDRIVWSETHYELFGYPPGDRFPVAFHHFADRLHPDDRPAVERAIREARATRKPYSNESRIVLPDGAVRWVQGSGEFRYDADGRPVRMLGTAVDITDRKQAEEALLASEARARAVINCSPVPMALNDDAQRITFLNLAFTRTFGYELADIPTLADWWPKAYPDPAYRQRVAETWQAELTRSAQTGTAFALMDLTIRCQDGTDRFVEANAAALAGTFAGTHLVVLHDITERKRAEQALRESELRYRTLIETSSDAIFLVDLMGRIRSANPAAVQMHGYSMDELLSMQMQDLDLPDDAAAVPDRMRRLRAGESLTFEVVHRRKDGSTFPVEVLASAVEIGGEWLVLAFDRDITERKRVEEAVRESEARLRVALAAAAAVAFVWDAATDSVVRYFSSEPALPANPDAPEPVAAVRAKIHPDDRAAFDAGLGACLSSGTEYRNSYRVVRADGTERWLEEWGTLSRDASGAPARLTGISVDFTERKRAEETVRRILEGLSPTTGREFFRALVAYLCQVCEVAYAFTGAIDPKEPERVRTIAVSGHGRPVDNFTYDLRGTPCEGVIGRTFCSYPTGVQRAFPEDHLLVEMGIDGYLGAPLWSSTGQPLGLIALLHDRPIPHPEQAEVVLKVIAARAGAELERQQADAALRESEERLRIFVQNAPAGVAMLDRDLRYLSYSRRWLTDYGLGEQNLLGRCHYEVFPDVTDRWKEIHRRCLTGVPEQCEEDRFDRADGSTDYLRWEIQPWTDATGGVGGLVFFTEMITERVKAEKQVRAALREKEAMLKEIHHRVKNNLQVISSLLSLQAGRATHPAAADVLAESQNRVRAMALVHETLYRSDDLARVDLPRYLGELCTYLFRAYGVDSGRVRLELAVEPVHVPLDKTIPCGLLVNEIVSNALKYAFPSGRVGTVAVGLNTDPDGRLALSIADDGIGLPSDVIIDRTPSLGLQLVNILAEQLGGSLSVERTGGTRFLISFAP